MLGDAQSILAGVALVVAAAGSASAAIIGAINTRRTRQNRGRIEQVHERISVIAEKQTEIEEAIILLTRLAPLAGDYIKRVERGEFGGPLP